jgi:NAD-dependent epimerase/dehydratase
MKKLLVIGGTGVLSSAVVAEAMRHDFEITMINRGHNRKRIPNGIQLIIADKSNIPYIEEQLKGQSFDAVIDFLCFNAQELEKSFRFYSCYTKQYFFISSACVYNNSIPGVYDEEHPKVQKLWNYSVNKWKSEKKLLEMAHGTDINYTIIRPMLTYDDTRIPYGITPWYGFHWTLVARILANKPIITWNEGKNRCNMMRVEDFAIGLVGLIGNSKAYNEAFNICGDETPTFKEVMDIVGQVIGHPVRYIDIKPEFYAQEDPAHKGELLGGRALDTVIDNSKIKRVVPYFEQRISLEEGIKRTLKAYKAQNYEKGIEWKYDANVDRIIRKWCKQRHIECELDSLGFVDYLHSATWKDRLTYTLQFYADNFFIKSMGRLKVKLSRFVLFLQKTRYQ